MRPMEALPEGEAVSLSARIDEGDLEGAVGDRARLTDELVNALLRDSAASGAVDVGPVTVARWLPVEQDAHAHWGCERSRSHDQIEVASVEAAGDLAARRVERGRLCLHRPVSRQRPLVEFQPRRGGIGMWLTPDQAGGGGEVRGALVTGVVFR